MTSRSSLALALALALLLPGCDRWRPPIDEWTACVFEPASRTMEHGATIAKPGTGAFLYAYAFWDRGGYAGESVMGQIEIDLPSPLSVGVERRIARLDGPPNAPRDETAVYRERLGPDGASSAAARSVPGTVRVIASDAQSVTLAVDLAPDQVQALHPSRDALPGPLRGTLKAVRAASVVQCHALRSSSRRGGEW